VNLQAALPPLSSTPGSLWARVYYPEAVDGSAIDCGRLSGEPTLSDGGEGEEADPSLNVIIDTGVPGGPAGDQSITFPLPLVPTQGATILLEAWSGGLNSATGLPGGSRLAAGCVDGQTISAPGRLTQTLSVDLTSD
jgi:hypothetical protein